MNGFLDTKGKLYECESYEHLRVAFRLAKQKGILANNGVEAEEQLQKLGWIVVRTNDVYELIGYPKESGSNSRYHLTKEQKDWLNKSYAHMTPSCRESVDNLFKMDK